MRWARRCVAQSAEAALQKGDRTLMGAAVTRLLGVVELSIEGDPASLALLLLLLRLGRGR